MKMFRSSPLGALAAGGAALAMALPALAQDGIVAPQNHWLWPNLQARVTLQTATLSPIAAGSLARHAETGALRGVQGGALFGDYIFARPGYGDFRATSGLLVGSLSGAPTQSLAIGRVGLSVLDGAAAGSAEPGALPYLGMGYSSPLIWGGLSVTADLGLVAGRPAGFSSVGKALFGNQAMDLALRELRLQPVLQFGVRYAF
jgi:hypothetical protein